MKKMIIAAAIAAGALASQAASFTWGTNAKAYSIAAETMTAGLTAGTTYGIGSGNASSMKDQISTYAAAWSYEITFSYGDKNDVVSGTLGSGDFTSRMIQKEGLASTIFDGATPDAPFTVDYSIVITGKVVDDTDTSWVITSNAITGQQKYAGTGDLNIKTAGPSSWSTVPEPTSGLLMLLGMAGLALRRRRA